MSVQVKPLKIDAPVIASLRRIAAEAVRLEALGYDGLRVAELNHDPFLPLNTPRESNSSPRLGSPCHTIQ